MKFNSIVRTLLAVCTAAVLATAACGCDDLGAYDDTEEYYATFGDIVLLDGTPGECAEYSVEDYFYNRESREDFLEGDDGAYSGVEHSDYVYMAIPFEGNVNMDTLALYMQSPSDGAVFINVYLVDQIPSNWRLPEDPGVAPAAEGDASAEESGDEFETEGEGEPEYDDPDPETRIGETTVYLKNQEWNSFVVDVFRVNGSTQRSIEITEGQYILLQFRNNSGIRVLDEATGRYVDPQTGLELQKAEITMTNLLIRALDVELANQTQGGE